MKNVNQNLDLKLKMMTPYCQRCSNTIMEAGSLENGSVSNDGGGGLGDERDYDDEESIDSALKVDKLSALEKAILDKIRATNVSKVLEENPKDIEIIRSKYKLILT
jgi:hypothetical protein